MWPLATFLTHLLSLSTLHSSPTGLMDAFWAGQEHPRLRVFAAALLSAVPHRYPCGSLLHSMQALLSTMWGLFWPPRLKAHHLFLSAITVFDLFSGMYQYPVLYHIYLYLYLLIDWNRHWNDLHKSKDFLICQSLLFLNTWWVDRWIW